MALESVSHLFNFKALDCAVQCLVLAAVYLVVLTLYSTLCSMKLLPLPSASLELMECLG